MYLWNASFMLVGFQYTLKIKSLRGFCLLQAKRKYPDDNVVPTDLRMKNMWDFPS